MTPVVIGGCYGVLHRAPGSCGAIICGSLGDEALSIHRSQVLLAEHLSLAGIPTLRLDYYGTGDSAGDAGRFQDWIDSISEAVRWMRAHCGVAQIALCGFRIGAALAARAAREVEDVAALVMFAPVTSGRRFLREQIFIARTKAEIWQSHHPFEDGQWFEANGLRIDLATRDALEQLDIARLRLPPRLRALVLDPTDAANSRNLVERLGGQGLEVAYATMDGLDRMLAESHESEVPHAAFARTVEWLGDTGVSNSANSPARCAVPVLDLHIARETAVRLGPGDSLAGILTMPACTADGVPAVLMVNTGANPRHGNSRGHVALARWLAESGVASLRIDGAGIGDAVSATGAHGLPYSEQGTEDVLAAVDFLASRCPGPIIVFGMCSGAYHAWHAALQDARISGLILVNLQKFIWRDGESLTVVQRTTLRTTQFYLRNLACGKVWRRLFAGRINVAGIGKVLACRGLRQFAAAMDPVVGAVRGETRVGMVRRQAKELATRSVPILYVLSGNDPGLDEASEYFGIRGWRLRRHANLTFQVIEKADHIFGAHWARERLRQNIGAYLHERFGMAVGGGLSS